MKKLLPFPNANDYTMESTYLGSICNFKTKSSGDRGLEAINVEYALQYVKLCEKFKNAPQETLGIEVIKLIQKFNREEIEYAKKHSIDYIENRQISLEDLETSYQTVEKILDFREKQLGKISPETNLNKVSFDGKKNEITEAQRLECHKHIHLTSLVCAGITAASGELSAFGADMPGLICMEFKMFEDLRKTLNVDRKSSFMHAANHMFSSGMVGANLVKTATSWLGIACHPVAAATTGGLGNIGITAGVRAANAALTASMCEYMGWAYVKDYQNGKMTPKEKAKELGATLAFAFLVTQFSTGWDLQKPAEALKDSAANALGGSIFHNLPNGAGTFIEAATKFVNSGAINYAAKGIEMVTPAIASTFIQNGGKLDSKSLEHIIKGSLFSLVCADVLGPAVANGDVLSENAKKLVGMMSNDRQIQEMLSSEFARRGLRQAGEIVVNKETVKVLESMYNELVPRLSEIGKTMGGLK